MIVFPNHGWNADCSTDDLFDASPVLVSKSGVCSPASNKRRFEFHTSSRHQKIAKR